MNARAKQIARHIRRAPEITRCSRHTETWLALALCYVGLRQPNYPFKIRLRDGHEFEFQNFPDVATWWQIFYRNIYPVHHDDRLIVDAGANIGAFTLYALNHAPGARIVAIEPFPPTFARLQSAVESSGSAKRVTLINAALGAEPGSVLMQDGDLASQFRRVLDSDAEQGTRVVCRTLAEIFSQFAGEIDFLKMDVEGSEYPTLLNCPNETLRRVRRMALEVHPVYKSGAPSRNELYSYLQSIGFIAEDIQDHGGGFGMAYFRRKAEY